MRSYDTREGVKKQSLTVGEIMNSEKEKSRGTVCDGDVGDGRDGRRRGGRRNLDAWESGRKRLRRTRTWRQER